MHLFVSYHVIVMALEQAVEADRKYWLQQFDLIWNQTNSDTEWIYLTCISPSFPPIIHF